MRKLDQVLHKYGTLILNASEHDIIYSLVSGKYVHSIPVVINMSVISLLSRCRIVQSITILTRVKYR